jgi:hypothetical protein
MTKTDDKPAFPARPRERLADGNEISSANEGLAARQLLAVMEERDKALAIADEVADEFMARGQVEEAFGANEVAERLRAAQQGEVTGSVAAPQE